MIQGDYIDNIEKEGKALDFVSAFINNFDEEGAGEVVIIARTTEANLGVWGYFN